MLYIIILYYIQLTLFSYTHTPLLIYKALTGRNDNVRPSGDLVPCLVLKLGK